MVFDEGGRADQVRADRVAVRAAGIVDAKLIAEAAASHPAARRRDRRDRPRPTPRMAAPIASTACRSTIPRASTSRWSAAGTAARTTSAHLLARLVFPSGGRLVVAGANFAEVHQAVPGRRIALCDAERATSSRDRFRTISTTASSTSRCDPATYDEAGSRSASRHACATR